MEHLPNILIAWANICENDFHSFRHYLGANKGRNDVAMAAWDLHWIGGGPGCGHLSHGRKQAKGLL